MTTVVTGKNQVTIPADVARQLRIERGTRLVWEVDPERRTARIRVAPSRGEIARSVWDTANELGKPGEHWVEDLVAERVRDDAAGRHDGGTP